MYTGRSSDGKFELGDYVLVKDNRQGFVRYIGSTGIVRGCLVGIELDEASPAGHDGRFGAKNYFECPKGHGTFVRPMDVIQVLSQSLLLDSSPTSTGIRRHQLPRARVGAHQAVAEE